MFQTLQEIFREQPHLAVITMIICLLSVFGIVYLLSDFLFGRHRDEQALQMAGHSILPLDVPLSEPIREMPAEDHPNRAPWHEAKPETEQPRRIPVAGKPRYIKPPRKTVNRKVRQITVVHNRINPTPQLPPLRNSLKDAVTTVVALPTKKNLSPENEKPIALPIKELINRAATPFRSGEPVAEDLPIAPPAPLSERNFKIARKRGKKPTPDQENPTGSLAFFVEANPELTQPTVPENFFGNQSKADQMEDPTLAVDDQVEELSSLEQGSHEAGCMSSGISDQLSPEIPSLIEDTPTTQEKPDQPATELLPATSHSNSPAITPAARSVALPKSEMKYFECEEYLPESSDLWEPAETEAATAQVESENVVEESHTTLLDDLLVTTPATLISGEAANVSTTKSFAEVRDETITEDQHLLQRDLIPERNDTAEGVLTNSAGIKEEREIFIPEFLEIATPGQLIPETTELPTIERTLPATNEDLLIHHTGDNESAADTPENQKELPIDCDVAPIQSNLPIELLTADRNESLPADTTNVSTTPQAIEGPSDPLLLAPATTQSNLLVKNPITEIQEPGLLHEVSDQEYDPQGLRFIGYQPNDLFSQAEPWSYPLVLMPKPGSVIRTPRPHRMPPRDVVEEMFILEMRRLFPAFEIEGDDCLPLSGSSKPYEPDISLIVKGLSLNLFIDVEIDEPYDSATRAPKHCLNEDQQRDTWFTDRGWMVIRIAEIQAKTQPRHCLALIAKVIHSVYPEYHIPSPLKDLPLPKPVLQWTHEEAIKMAEDQLREKYLNIKEFEKQFWQQEETKMELTDLELKTEKWVNKGDSWRFMGLG